MTSNSPPPDPSLPKQPSPRRPDPTSVIASTAVARTLTISDQHANILLTSLAPTDPGVPAGDGSTNPEKPTRSLLKLTLVPFHKTELATIFQKNGDKSTEEPSIPDGGKPEGEGQNNAEMEKEHSDRVVKFLSQFDWRLTSESGAEYSFYEAFPKNRSRSTAPENADDEQDSEPDAKRTKTDAHDDFNTNQLTGEETTVTKGWSTFKAELISPASDRQVSRAMPSPGLIMITETPDLYSSVTKPFIDEIVASGSLSWIKNIVEVRKEKERLLHNADGWILNIDTKWRTHPDALTAPRSEWFRHESVADLYCLGILKADGVATLRDLTTDHLPALRDMLRTGPTIIESVYGIPADQLRIFVHYQPQFYHFHVHFTRLENDTGAQAEKAHLLADVVQNLEADSMHYAKRTMTYKLSLKDRLYKAIDASKSTAVNEEKDEK